MRVLPHDPFGRTARLPLDDRERRVALIGRAAQALLAGEMPDVEARLFLGGALTGWLEGGGSLERDYLRVVKPKSHVTPRAIWKRMRGSF